jgi:hypothetical protein
VYLPLPTIGSIVSPFVFYQRRYSASYAPAAAFHEPILHREYATTLIRPLHVENSFNLPIYHPTGW